MQVYVFKLIMEQSHINFSVNGAKVVVFGKIFKKYIKQS
jgi:hypothetical protein